MLHYYPVTPMAKPRMTRADGFTLRRLNAGQRLGEKQQKRAAILTRWLAFKDEVRLRSIHLPATDGHVIFVMPMPPSWNAARRDAMRAQPHRGKRDKAIANDTDNLAKALMDAVFGDDSGVADLRASKIWHDKGGIFVLHDEFVGRLPVPFPYYRWLARAQRAATGPDRVAV